MKIIIKNKIVIIPVANTLRLYWQILYAGEFPCPYTANVHKRCPWCEGYRLRKWTRQYEFESWTKLIAFHIALIPLGKVWIQLFSLHLPLVGQTRFFSIDEATSLGEGKLMHRTVRSIVVQIRVTQLRSLSDKYRLICPRTGALV